MIKRKRISSGRDTLVAGAGEVLARHTEVIFAYLFGGLAKHDMHPLSDIDIAVYVDRAANLAREKLDLLGDLTNTLETEEIDLVILNVAPLPLSARVVSSNRILLDRDPFFRHAYESLVLREYFDFSVKENAILKRRFLVGR